MQFTVVLVQSKPSNVPAREQLYCRLPYIMEKCCMLDNLTRKAVLCARSSALINCIRLLFHEVTESPSDKVGLLHMKANFRGDFLLDTCLLTLELVLKRVLNSEIH